MSSLSLHRKEKKIDKDKIQPKLFYEPFSSQISSEPTAMKKTYLTIIRRARMGSESIAHEAEGRMGYSDSEAMRARGIIVLVQSN